MMASSSGQPYDAVPYPSLASPRTHPSHLAALGRMFGVACRTPANCRLLELGCAAGGNLLPMAVDYPGSQFVGVDASAMQVADGQTAVSDLGLANLDLQALDIMALPDDLGAFDYILCHGVFSWVPRPVQDQILRICQTRLAPGGIGFITYNTYPGWHLRAVVRDMMLYHTRNWTEPRERIQQARALLDFLVQSASGRTEAYRQVVRDEAEIVRQHADAYLFHEHLEEVNEALYFHQFMDRARAAGLQYVGDTEFASMMPVEFGAEVAQLLRDAPREVQEQYLDFLRNRSFRGTLLCHQNVRLDQQLDFSHLNEMDVALENEADLQKTMAGLAAVTQAGLQHLARLWPAAVPFPALVSESLRQVGQNSDVGEEGSRLHRTLIHDVLRLFARKVLRLRVDSPRCTAQVSERPRVSPLVRRQARWGGVVTNRRHESLSVSELSRWFLSRLDGASDQQALREAFRSAVTRGELVVSRDGKAMSSPNEELLTQIVTQAIESFARDALLVS